MQDCSNAISNAMELLVVHKTIDIWSFQHEYTYREEVLTQMSINFLQDHHTFSHLNFGGLYEIYLYSQKWKSQVRVIGCTRLVISQVNRIYALVGVPHLNGQWNCWSLRCIYALVGVPHLNGQWNCWSLRCIYALVGVPHLNGQWNCWSLRCIYALVGVPHLNGQWNCWSLRCIYALVGVPHLNGQWNCWSLRCIYALVGVPHLNGQWNCWSLRCIYALVGVPHLNGQWNCWSLRCSWSIACRRCSNDIFILNLTHGFIGLSKGNYKTRRETFKFWKLLHLISEVLRYRQGVFVAANPYLWFVRSYLRQQCPVECYPGLRKRVTWVTRRIRGYSHCT